MRSRVVLFATAQDALQLCFALGHLLRQFGRLLLYVAEQLGIFMRDGHLGRQRNGQPFVDLTEGVAAEFIDQSQPAIDLQLIANGHAEEGIDNHPLVQAVHEQLVHGGLIHCLRIPTAVHLAAMISERPGSRRSRRWCGSRSDTRAGQDRGAPPACHSASAALPSFVGQLIGHQAQVLVVEHFLHRRGAER